MEFQGKYLIAAGGDERRYCCPFCLDKVGKVDREYKLYVHSCGGICNKCTFEGINLDGSYTCQRCKTSRSKNYDAKLTPRRCYQITIDDLVSDFLSQNSPPIPPAEVKPSNIQDIRQNSLAYTYCLSRNLTDRDIEYYQIKQGLYDADKDKNLFGRIVIPNLDTDGRWTYWTARTYTNNFIRYKLPPVSTASRVTQVFNLERLQSEEAHLVEGSISSIRGGLDFLATYGKGVSDEQIKRIVRRGVKKIWCILDSDARKENIKLAYRLERAGIEAWIIDLPYGKDPADLGREAIMALKSSAKRYSITTEIERMFERAEGLFGLGGSND